MWGGELVPAKLTGESEAKQKEAQNSYLKRLFLRGLNRNYKEDVKDLDRAFIKGQDNYLHWLGSPVGRMLLDT